MLQRRWRTETREVRHVMYGLIPVAGIGGRRHQRWPQGRQLVWIEYCHGGGHGDQHDPERGQQSSRPPDPESAQIQTSMRVAVRRKEIGDQVPAEHEEDIDAEEASRYRANALMEGHDRENRKRSHPIEAW